MDESTPVPYTRLAYRPEFEHEVLPEVRSGPVERPLGAAERLWGYSWLRRGVILVLLALAWEGYARWLDNPLAVPAFSEAVISLWQAVSSGELPERLFSTLRVLMIGYAIGVLLAGVFTTLAVSSRFGTDLLVTLTAMLNPLPSIALLPLALIWFGLGTPSLVFVIANSVLWAVALNAHAGFLGVSETQRMAGQNVGLRRIRYVTKLLIPAAFPSILTGLRIGWAFAWRTLIAAELVFGVSSRSGGIGWFIYEARTQLDTARVFAGLLTVIIVGLLVEGIAFRLVEDRTVRRWGMQR